MSQLPAGHFPINPNTTSGTFLATILNDEEQALLSSQSGATAPVVALAGSFWLDTSSVTSYVLKIYTGSVWVALSTFDPSTGSASAGGQAVVSVNNRIGAVKIKELYDFTETAILAQGTTDGIDLIINQDVDPNANLLATTGRLAFDTTKNIFVGYNGTAWTGLGGGQYIQYANEIIAGGGSISNNNIAGLQYRPISSAADITIGAVPFVVPAPLWAGGFVIAVKNSGTFKIVFNDSNATASGLVTADPIELDPNKTIQFIFDNITNRWYPAGGAGGGAGKFITYPLQGLAAAGTITALPDKGFQFRRVNSGANISLSNTPFGNAALFIDGLVLNIINLGANNISFPDGSLIQYGFYNNGYPLVLGPGQLAAFQYDLNQERFYLIGTSASGGSGGGGGAIVNDQTVAAAGQITLLPVGRQSIKLTSAAPITLGSLPFIIPNGLADRAIIELFGTSDTNTQTIAHNDVANGVISFGDTILKNWYCKTFEYQAGAGRFVELSKNY